MYDAFRYISMYYTVTNGFAAFDTLQEPIPHITVYYICIHKLITFVTLLNFITPQWRIASEFVREQSHFETHFSAFDSQFSFAQLVKLARLQTLTSRVRVLIL